ncbi:hypothetical protein D1AOALGA4SA_7423 [Olavius algarvensis Delta 1 endosymbiont]|nr:hypothetical protein D1AOALGA4SA_7423 [Olavius algarvensis Delta 1 endosymbiont]
MQFVFQSAIRIPKSQIKWLDARYWILDTRCRILDTYCRMPGPVFRLPRSVFCYQQPNTDRLKQITNNE